MGITADNRLSLGSPFTDIYDAECSADPNQHALIAPTNPPKEKGIIVKLSGTGATITLKPGEAPPEVGLYGGPLAFGQKWEPVKE